MASIVRSFTVTPADQASDPYYYVPFAVPDGTTRIDVALSYPKAENCIIDLGCFDPTATGYPSATGFRGWSGGARERFFVARDDATPGYVHGEIPVGDWNVILGLYKLPPQGAPVELSITLDSAERPKALQPVRTFPVRKGAGWYKGDLHCHTFHSDARGGPELLHAAARQAGLDFLAVADHNTITQRRYFHPASSPDLVFVRAMEVTTAIGHANVFGADQWIDFRMTRPEHAHTLAEMVHGAGGLLSINHDKPDIPWGYEWPDADLMEVWQSTWLAWNWISLERYQQRLAAGLRISAIGGSDYHQPDRLLPEGPLVLARPTTVLWLEELSEDAVLAAMKAGRGYVTESPDGPHLELSVGDAPMGASLPAGRVKATARVKCAARDILVWLDAGGEIAREVIRSDDALLTLDAEPRGFLRCEVVAEAARSQLLADLRLVLADNPLPWGLTEDIVAAQPVRRALSNPIYFDPEVRC
ncbi:CehA/McbA family metallohydrolase [Pelagibacterium limicola]|uniref:CehA/McbA family metallohydrolase n=1 Tax=Pelagibacterium limicola TaxID=2791022 RepID=UPI0018AFBF28|nr:CehA/McbA family metallohydrolase [Pelagibacterium limicola]